MVREEQRPGRRGQVLTGEERKIEQRKRERFNSGGGDVTVEDLAGGEENGFNRGGGEDLTGKERKI